MRHSYYPVALIFFALSAEHAVAAPRADALAQCTLAGATPAGPFDEIAAPARAEAGQARTPEGSACSGAAPAPARPGALEPVIAGPIGRHLLIRDAVHQTLAAIRRAVLVPLRYGCAVIGGGSQPAKPKRKPRMLTLF